MTTRFTLLALLAAALMSFGGCDFLDRNDDEPDAGQVGPLTTCAFSYTNPGAGFGLGEACTQNGDCSFGKCMLPGETGNIINDQFGFCTRSCDCNNDPNARLTTEEKKSFTCLYPQVDSSLHHVVPSCAVGGLMACQAFGDYNLCKDPSEGGATKVCQAK